MQGGGMLGVSRGSSIVLLVGGEVVMVMVRL